MRAWNSAAQGLSAGKSSSARSFDATWRPSDRGQPHRRCLEFLGMFDLNVLLAMLAAIVEEFRMS